MLYGGTDTCRMAKYLFRNMDPLFGGGDGLYKTGTSTPSVFGRYNDGILYIVRGVDNIDTQEILTASDF